MWREVTSHPAGTQLEWSRNFNRKEQIPMAQRWQAKFKYAEAINNSQWHSAHLVHRNFARSRQIPMAQWPQDQNFRLPDCIVAQMWDWLYVRSTKQSDRDQFLKGPVKKNKLPEILKVHLCCSHEYGAPTGAMRCKTQRTIMKTLRTNPNNHSQ